MKLTPPEPTRKSIITLSATGFDISKATVEWLVNGSPFVPLVPTQFNGAEAAKGDTVQAKASVQGREILSNTVQIVNTPPELTNVRIEPETFRPGDTLSVKADARDDDDDEVSILYEWKKNGEPAGTGEHIEGSLKRGDSISVKITPTDGKTNGNSIVLTREIANWPPVIVQHDDFNFDGSVYTYQVRASDPDGDTLTYTLQPSVVGMTIDSSTGLLTWHVPPEFIGRKEVSIDVRDGHGGTAQYKLAITIS